MRREDFPNKKDLLSAKKKELFEQNAISLKTKWGPQI